MLHMRDLNPVISLVRPLDSDFWSQEQINTLKSGGGNREFNNFMERYDLSGVGCDLHRKYNSVGCQYWRDKLHQMSNGLMPQTEIPTKTQGVVQMDRDVEGDWLLVDRDSAIVQPPAKTIDLSKEGRDNSQVESEGQAYLDESEDFRGYSDKSSMGTKTQGNNDDLG